MALNNYQLKQAEEKEYAFIDALREEKKRLALADLFYFGKYVLGYDFEVQPHKSFCDDMMNHDNNLNLEPRGVFKTTMTIAYIIREIVLNPDVRIMIDCEDLSLAKKILDEIKTHFERNEEFITLFGDYVGKEKWSETSIIVSKRKAILKDPTINTSSIEVNRTGAHVDIMVEDDLHSDFNSKTPEQIDKVEAHHKLNMSILDPGGKNKLNGTRWAVRDLYGRMIEQEKARRNQGLGKKYHIRVKDAETSGPDNGLYFPSRLTKEFLAEKRFDQGSYIYACQYRNNPVDEDAIKFKPSWIRFYGRYAPDRLYVTQTWDFAISTKDEGCFNACVTVGTDLDGYMYILDAYRFKADTNKVVDEIFNQADKWKPREIGIEVYAFQKALKFWIDERGRMARNFLPIKELKTDTKVSKEFRICALMPYVENGTIQFPGQGKHSLEGNMLDLYIEMVEYPVGAYVDTLDALSSQLQLYSPASKPKVIPAPPIRNIATLLEIERKKVAAEKRKKNGLPMLGRHNQAPKNYSFPSGLQRVN